LGGNGLSVVTFNYDRSFEHYLFTTIKSRYGVDDKDCAAILNEQIKIVHVYGSLGKLPWQKGATPENTVTYDHATADTQARVAQIKIASDNIKIHHEGDAQTQELQQAAQLIEDAEQLVFLGFSYHPDNLSRLGITEPRSLPIRTLGTSRGLDRDTSSRFLQFCKEQKGVLFNVDVYTLLREHVIFR
jgi:hypothetical protein